MTVDIENAIAFLKGYRQVDENLFKTIPNDTVGYNATKICLKFWDMAIKGLKSLEAWEKVKEELKESSYEHYFEFGEYIGEDTQKVRIIRFDTAMNIIDKYLKEVENDI